MTRADPTWFVPTEIASAFKEATRFLEEAVYSRLQPVVLQ